MLPEKWRKVERVLAVRLDNIGDIIMLGPSLRTLRRALPGAHIALLASPAGSQAAPLLPWIDEVIVHRPVWQDISGSAFDAREHLEFIESLRARRFDAALIFTSFPQSPHPPAYACFLAGIPLRVGQSKEFGGSLLTRWVKPLPDYLHQSERDLYLLEAEGFTPCGRHLELAVPEEAQRSAEALLARAGVGAGADFLLVAPGASCQARRYEARRFAEVVRLLAGKAGMPVLLAGSGREAGLEETIRAAAGGERVVSLVGRTSLPELAAVIGKARLVVANDSGSMHLADAFGRPMVILFSGTDIEEQWKPRKAPARLLRRTTRCAPCYLFSCAHDMECLDIPPEEVAEEALDLLASAGGARAAAALRAGPRNMTAAAAGRAPSPPGSVQS